MKNALVALVLVAGLAVVGCNDGNNDSTPTPAIEAVESIAAEEVEAAETQAAEEVEAAETQAAEEAETLESLEPEIEEEVLGEESPAA